MSLQSCVKEEINDIISVESFDEHNDIVKQVGNIISINTFNATIRECKINSKFTLPIETKYCKYNTSCTDFHEVYLWIYITPQNQIVIEIKAGCWRRWFEIKHPNTLKYLLQKIRSYDLWTLNEILSKRVTIKSFK